MPEGTNTFPNYWSWHVLWVTYTKCNFCWECQGERPQSRPTMCCAVLEKCLIFFLSSIEYCSSTTAVWSDVVCLHKLVLHVFGSLVRHLLVSQTEWFNTAAVFFPNTLLAGLSAQLLGQKPLISNLCATATDFLLSPTWGSRVWFVGFCPDNSGQIALSLMLFQIRAKKEATDWCWQWHGKDGVFESLLCTVLVANFIFFTTYK